MKKQIAIILISLFAVQCADSKDFVIDGKKVTVEPYGWFDLEAKNDSIKYGVCTGNVVWSVILVETVLAPIVITGNSLYEPLEKK